MAYIINRYDGSRLIVIDDGILDTSIPVGLVGRNYTGWGEVFNENFVFLAENFKGTSPPPRALEGQAWYDSNGKVLKAYDGDKWNPIGNAEVSETAPNNTKGGLWLKSTTDQLYVSVENEWKLVGPEGLEGFGTTRVKSEILSDRTGQPYPVSISYIDGQPISIFSAYKFDLQSGLIPGFSSIEVGLTFRSDSFISGNLKGNADTTTALKTPRTINTIPFDGSQNIVIKSSTTNPLRKGDYIVGSDWDGTLTDTWSVDASPENRIGKVVARDANGEFSAERIMANITGNLTGNVTALSGTSNFSNIVATRITAPDFIGNASTATRLETPRRINTIEFDGTTNITLPVPAETLVGNALAPNVISSSLTSLGKLISLGIEDEGLVISNNDSRLKIFVNGFSPTLRSELSNQIKLELLSGSSQSSISDISYISAASTSLVAISGPALVPDWNKTVSDSQKINLGLPDNQWNTVYSNNFRGRDLSIDRVNSDSGVVNFQGTVTVNQAVSAPTFEGNLIGNVTGNLVGNVTGSASLNALKSGDNFTGDIGWTASDRGITWSAFTDKASIKFYTSGDTDQDTRLEFNTGDNGNEYFLFSHTFEAGNKINLMRLDPNDNFGNVRMSLYGNIEATGRVTANRFIGIGTDLTNIDANKITQGRIPNQRLTGSYDIGITGNAATVSSITSGQITGALGYIPANLAGSTLSGDWNWNSTNRGLNWAFNTDGASIRFYNLSDGDTDSRLEFETRDNGNEYFRWTHSPSGGSNFESMRLVPNSFGNSVLTVRGNISATNSISAANLLGSGAAITNLNAGNLSVGTVPVGRLSGTYSINISGNSNTVSNLSSGQIVAALGYTPVNPASLQNQAGAAIVGADASFSGVLNVSAGIGGGIRFPNDAFGGSGDTARITLETKGGEATTLTFRVTNDADDTIGFFAPTNNGLTMNNNIVLHAANYTNYTTTRTGGGASGTWPINISGTSSFANTATNATNVIGGSATLSTAAISGVLNVSAGSNGGIRFPDDAFGGGFDTARITLETKGGEATRLTLRVTNDADDTIEFFTPARDGVRSNGHIVLHAANYNDYAPTRSGGGASGTWPINITGNANTVNTITSSQVISALGFTPVASTTFPGGPISATTGQFSGVLRVSAGSPQVSGIAFPNDAYGGGGDTATITLESAGGERTRMRFRITNDAGITSVDDKFEFIGPDNNSLLMNGNVVLHTGNFNSVIGSGNVKAWVRFRSNGSLISSFNVNSVTRLGSGRYRVNINSGVFANGNFAAAGMASDVDHFVSLNTYSVGGATSATRIDINTIDNGSGNDSPSDSVETMVIMVA